jgi:hypothetical protein
MPAVCLRRLSPLLSRSSCCVLAAEHCNLLDRRNEMPPAGHCLSGGGDATAAEMWLQVLMLLLLLLLLHYLVVREAAGYVYIEIEILLLLCISRLYIFLTCTQVHICLI